MEVRSLYDILVHLPPELRRELLMILPYHEVRKLCQHFPNYRPICNEKSFWISKAQRDIGVTEEEFFEPPLDGQGLYPPPERYLELISKHPDFPCAKGSERYVSAEECFRRVIKTHDFDLIRYFYDLAQPLNDDEREKAFSLAIKYNEPRVISLLLTEEEEEEGTRYSYFILGREAARFGNVDILKQILPKLKTDVLAIILEEGVSSNSPDVVKLILPLLVCDIDKLDPDEVYSLARTAAYINDVSLLKLLMNLYWDLDLSDSIFYGAMIGCHRKLAEKALSLGATNISSTLQDVAGNGNLEMLLWYFQQYGVFLDSEAYGNIIKSALANRHLDIVRMMFDMANFSKVPLNAKDILQSTDKFPDDFDFVVNLFRLYPNVLKVKEKDWETTLRIAVAHALANRTYFDLATVQRHLPRDDTIYHIPVDVLTNLLSRAIHSDSRSVARYLNTLIKRYHVSS